MNRIGYVFKDQDLLISALTHTSAVTRGREESGSYERLEFVGDRVIGLLVAQRLFETFHEATAGEMNRRLSALVRRETMAEVALEMGLEAYIIMSPGEAEAGGRAKPAILADVMEAVLGAVYMEGGLTAVQPIVDKFWRYRFSQPAAALQDPKSALQEWSQGHHGGLPVYTVLQQRGSDHEPEFVVSCHVMGRETQAVGPSKRAAERAAAQAWLGMFMEADA